MTVRISLQVLYFRRALKLEPGNAKVKANLEKLAALIGDGEGAAGAGGSDEEALALDKKARQAATAGHAAKALRLFRKAAERGLAAPDGRTLVLKHEAERELTLHLLDFGRAVVAAFDSGKPSTLATYLYELASRYHSWYQACSVLKAEDERVAMSRLNLNLLAQRTLVQGLDLLGIGAPEKM